MPNTPTQTDRAANIAKWIMGLISDTPVTTESAGPGSFTIETMNGRYTVTVTATP